MNSGVSLCMIVKNEEDNLGRCLTSIKDIVDEMIIVDTGSTDETVAIAESFGAKVYHFPWTNSFSEARNESLKHATKEWILIMDADDEFCKEDKERLQQLIQNGSEDNNLYFFETLNYCGGFPDSNNISVNLNPRLFKNNYGFYYEGEVHNQLVNYKNNRKDINLPIRIYHYGYLDNNIKVKNKRERNISLLKEQLKNEPNNKYACFNLANEYFALEDIQKALDFYYKSYEEFSPNIGYGFILMIRIVIANYYLGLYDKALEFADIGLKYYPGFTDLYFFKAIIYKVMARPTLAIKSFEKCIEMGESPAEFKFLYGTGSFKPIYELGNIYLELKDYHTAFRYFNAAIKAKSDFVLPVCRIAHILKEEKTPIADIKNVIENFFENSISAYAIIADIFYTEEYYKTALEYIIKCEENKMISEDILILKVKSLIRIGEFEQCINLNSLKSDSKFYTNAFLYKVISYLLTDQTQEAVDQIDSFNRDVLTDKDKKMFDVYSQFIKLYTKKPTQILSEDENEKGYTGYIFELCEILLLNRKFDEFIIALNLMNLISDKSVLLQLGKLYYKHGFKEMGKKELVRSIKEFEVFDAEALDMLK
jgi:glycosyltransferase involved in cell wall biosynthesis